MTVRSSVRATTGWTKPNRRRLLVREFEFLVANPSRVRRVLPKEIDRDLLDRQRGQGSLNRHLVFPPWNLFGLPDAFP